MGGDGGGGLGADWDVWKTIPLPYERSNFWNEPYAELFDWLPWLRPLYSKWEIEHDCEPVRLFCVRENVLRSCTD